MYESPGGNAAGSDAELLNAIRSGHAGSYELLRARHAAAARSLAGHIALPPGAAGGAVEEAFSRVLDALRMGGGPSDAFRPYLLTAVRRAADDRAGGDGTQVPEDGQDPGPGRPEPEAASTDPDAGPAVAAFLSLPERWRAVLWHISIEGADPEDAARLLGLPPQDAGEIADQARDGFARAYLDQTGEDSAHADLAGIDTLLRSTIAPVVLGDAAVAYLADGAGQPGTPAWPGPATISTATGPGAVISLAMPAVPSAYAAGAWAYAPSPTVTGPGVGALAGTDPQGTATGGPAGAAAVPTVWSVMGGTPGATGTAAAPGGSGTAGVGAAGRMSAWPPLPADVGAGARAGAGGGAGASAGMSAAAGVGAAAGAGATAGSGAGRTGLIASWQQSSPRRRRATAAVCALLAAGAVAGTVLALGAGSSPASQAASDRTVLSSPAAAPSPAATPDHPAPKAAASRHHRKHPHRQHHKKHAPVAPPRQGPPSHSPAPHPRRHPPATVVAAVNVIGPVGNSHAAEVTFGATNTGGSRTGKLTAEITLPTGSALAPGLGVAGGNGWTCNAAGHGARCVHQPIRAGSRASGSMYIVIMRTTACGRPVGITVSGARAPASAQSPRGIACQARAPGAEQAP